MECGGVADRPYDFAVKRSEKITISAILLSLIAAFSLYGVWEDKVLLYAPLLLLIYVALAGWTVAAPNKAGVLAILRNASSGRGQVASNGSSASHTPTRPHFRIPSAGGMLLLFWLFSAALIPFAVIPYEAKISTLRVGAYIGCYWMLANSLSRSRQSRIVLMTVLSTLVLIALYSLVQHRSAPNLIFGMERYTAYWGGGRLGGTYQCPNHIAHLLQMWLPFCFALLFVTRLSMFWRITCAYAISLFMLVIYQTQSRAGMLGSIAALGVTALLLILRKSRKLFFIALIAVPLLGVGTLGGLWLASSMFRERMTPVVKFIEHQFSGSDINEEFQDFRPQTWADSWGMITDKPLFGHGPGNYGQVFPEYRQRIQWNRRETVHPHNEYVELLAEYGFVGGLLALAAVVSALAVLLRLYLRTEHTQHAYPVAALIGTIAGTAVHGFFDFELRIFPNALMLALLAGCAVGPILSARRADATSAGALRAHSCVRWLIVLVALWSVQVMSSAWIRAWGDRIRAQRALPTAERLYKVSRRIDPQNWQAHLGLGQVCATHRFYALDPALKREWGLKERDTFDAAFRHNTKKEEVVYGLGRAELALGNRETGLDYLRQAASYKRFNDFYWRKLGLELRKAGFYEEALAAFEYALQLDRSNKTVKRNIQWIDSM